jgi:hypothetical protein
VAPVSRINFPSPPTETQSLRDSDFFWQENRTATDACSFLESKRGETLIERGQKIKTFQLYRSFFSDGSGAFFGSHAIGKLPQVMFMLSAEGPDSDGRGPLYRAYDRWDFYTLAKKYMCPVVPAYCGEVKAKDRLWDELKENQRRSDILENKIARLKLEQNVARRSSDRDAVAKLREEIIDAEIEFDTAIVKIQRIRGNIDTANVKIENAANDVKTNGTEEQITAVKNLEDVTFAFTYWDSNYVANSVVRSVYDIREKFALARNAKIAELVNEQAPGAFDDDDRALDNAYLFKTYVNYLKQVYPYESRAAILKHINENLESLRPMMTSEFTLFGDAEFPTSWKDQELDVASSVALLSVAPTNLQDASCKFLIAQRLMAQIISLKGIRQSPELDANGFLLPLSSDPEVTLPARDVPGVFGFVVEPDWIKEQAAKKSYDVVTRPAGVTDSSGRIIPTEFFSWVRLLADVAASANAPFWVKNKDTPQDHELIPSALLQCSFGLMAVGMISLDPHIVRKVDNTTDIDILPENHPHSFVVLVETTIRAIEALEAIYTVHKLTPEMGFLDNRDLEKIRKDNGENTYQRLHYLLYAANKAIMNYSRRQGDNMDPLLVQTIRHTGAFLRNESFYVFPKKITK